MTEKEKVIECIKALSRIEGATMAMGGLTNRDVFTQNIDVIMKYFEWALNGANLKWEKNRSQSKDTLYKPDFESCRISK